MDTPSMAAVLRFSRYRERPALAAAPAGAAPGATGPRCNCPCMALLEVVHWRVWAAGWLGAGCCYTCTCCPSSASGQPQQPGLGEGTGPDVGPRDSRRIT